MKSATALQGILAGAATGDAPVLLISKSTGAPLGMSTSTSVASPTITPLPARIGRPTTSFEKSTSPGVAAATS